MRLELQRKTDLAIRALTSLEGGRMKGPDLADAIGTTPAFVAHVMTPLVQRGWVQSEPGPTGGYRRVLDLESVSMLDVIEAVEGPTVTGKCVLRGGPCITDENCALHDAWMRARTALLDELAAIPLSTLELEEAR
jgi:Rrf2 family iron-sulfur cluster assembly transcriptional regulator